MTGTLTSDQAVDLLRKSPVTYKTPDQLRSLVARVDANASGKLTVLYSGELGRGMWSNDVIKGMIAAGENVRVINKSQAAAFMESKKFYSAVAKAYRLTDFRLLEDGTYRGPATEWTTSRRALGPTSRPFCRPNQRRSTHHRQRCITPGCSARTKLQVAATHDHIFNS